MTDVTLWVYVCTKMMMTIIINICIVLLCFITFAPPLIEKLQTHE